MENEAAANQTPESPVQAANRLRVEKEDTGHLDRVLRGYYLGQIRQIEGRRDRRKARILIENHLVLPKSRQRTSKDAAYIREVIGVEDNLLAQLEESRLIRRLNQGGNMPIFEVSHDTLVEPILAERHNREAVLGFLRRYGRWFLLLMLLLFAFGMLFENWFDIVDDSLAFRAPGSQEVHLEAESDLLANQGTHLRTLVVPFSNFKDYRNSDSLTLHIGVQVTAHPALDRVPGLDTVLLNLGALPVQISKEALQHLLESGRDTAIPLRVMVPVGADDGQGGLLADVAGTTFLRLGGQPDEIAALPPGAAQRTRGMDQFNADLGRRTVQAGKSTRIISLDTVVNLPDLLPNDEVARSLLAGKSMRLTYQVQVAPAPGPAKTIEYVPVSGIEVQYSDGTRHFIPGEPGGGTGLPLTHTVKPGETLYKISKLYGLTTAQLRQLNQLSDNNIRVGQVLKLK